MIAIVGGGPAGLRAAEAASGTGAPVTLFDSQPSVGRKFLVAGGGGLNLTNVEPRERFLTRYSGPAAVWEKLISDFGPEELRKWAAGLGVETFAASSGRVYPVGMKSAPLLRRWVRRLRERGVKFAMRHRLQELAPELKFATPDGQRTVEAGAVVLALGGGSWPQTGSDGVWIAALEERGVAVRKLTSANCGWEVAWPQELLCAAEGKPIKNVSASAAGQQVRGELLITSYGLEGGAIYQLGAALRQMEEPVLEIDFKPDVSVDGLVRKLGPARRNLLAEARSRWRLDDAAHAVLAYHAELPVAQTPESLALLTKNCRICLARPRPLAEAISSAGGVDWDELDSRLMLRKMPGVFVAGEMIDWEAPTGGYLMQGCFATGDCAGREAAAWICR